MIYVFETLRQTTSKRKNIMINDFEDDDLNMMEQDCEGEITHELLDGNGLVIHSFDISQEYFDEMCAFSEDGRARFVYIILMNNENGKFEKGYSGKKTSDTLFDATNYFGSSTDMSFSRETIKSNRKRYNFIVIGYCRDKHELGKSENAINQYFKATFKTQWANKHLGNGLWSVEGLTPIIKDGQMKMINPDDFPLYSSDGWVRGNASTGTTTIIKDGQEKRINPDDFPLYSSDGWVRGNSLTDTISIIKDGQVKRINPDDFPLYSSEGWVRGNYLTDTISIIKDGQEKRINPDDFPLYSSDGWVRGNYLTDTISIIKDGQVKMINPNDFPLYSSEGWVRGNASKGTISIIKDGQVKMINPDDFPLYSSDGWVRGNSHIGTITIIKDGQGKQINPNDLDSYLNDGWRLGNKRSLKTIQKGSETQSVYRDDLLPYLKDGWCFVTSEIKIHKEPCASKTIRFKGCSDLAKQHQKLIKFLEDGWSVL